MTRCKRDASSPGLWITCARPVGPLFDKRFLKRLSAWPRRQSAAGAQARGGRRRCAGEGEGEETSVTKPYCVGADAEAEGAGPTADGPAAGAPGAGVLLGTCSAVAGLGRITALPGVAGVVEVGSGCGAHAAHAAKPIDTTAETTSERMAHRFASARARDKGSRRGAVIDESFPCCALVSS